MTLKLIFVQLILCLTSLACCYGQTNQLINIPVIKENVRVDSALDKFIAKRPISLEKLSKLGGEYNDDVKMLLKDSCLLIGVYKVDSLNRAGIYVQSKTKTGINQEINIYDHLKFKYACFQYKGYKVFVQARDNFDWLFSKANRTQSYGFIYYADKTQTYPRDFVRDGANYQFKNSTFSDRGVPTIITKKQNK